jgi:hypothetical protein
VVNLIKRSSSEEVHNGNLYAVHEDCGLGSLSRLILKDREPLTQHKLLEAGSGHPTELGLHVSQHCSGAQQPYNDQQVTVVLLTQPASVSTAVPHLQRRLLLICASHNAVHQSRHFPISIALLQYNRQQSYVTLHYACRCCCCCCCCRSCD